MEHQRRIKQGLLLSMVLLLAACGGSNTPTPGGSDGYLLTLKLESGDTKEAVAQRYGGEAIVWRPEDGLAVLKVSSANTASGDVSVLSLAPNTTLAAPEVLASGYTTAGGWNAWSGGWNAWSGGWNAWSGGTGSVFSPTENTGIWSKIRLQQAHALATNLGRGVKVAVIDTGVDLTHPAFRGRLAPSSEWKDYVDGDAYPAEVGQVGNTGFGHGTNVAGIVAQVAPNATILPIRVLDGNGQGSLANVVSAVDWAIQRGAGVINLSLGTSYTAAGSAELDALGSLMMTAIERGIQVVASAGNHAQNSLTVPAANARSYTVRILGSRTGQLTSVGSVDLNDQRSVFSNFGPDMEIVALGERVFAPAPGGRLAFWSGTSMAAPMVSGAYALALGESARWKVTITSSGLETFLFNNSDSLGINLGRRLNLERFMTGILR